MEFSAYECLLGDMVHTSDGRAAQKLQTRRALLEAALRLMEHQSLSSLSLREVARAAGIVPTGFYRHFPDMQSLGVALVDQSLGGLRTAIRAVRIGRTDGDQIIRHSLRVLAKEVRAHRDEFRFLARERHGALPRVRAAIEHQLDLFGQELASDLVGGEIAPTLGVGRWEPDELRMLTQLIVNQMVQAAAALLDGPANRPSAQQQVVDVTTRQLRLIVLGARHWHDPA